MTRFDDALAVGGVDWWSGFAARLAQQPHATRSENDPEQQGERHRAGV
jgi:hypothetical protein